MDLRDANYILAIGKYGNIPAAAELAARNYGIAFIPEPHVKHMHLSSEIRCFSVGDPVTHVDFVAARRKNGYLPKYAQEYVSIVKDFT